MLSIILYGRNDSYGYNLHKRAALSLNCMAEVIDEGDEILFVDYNTPDDYPTFPEAIRDTLTERARRLLRIFRVRPAQHARFRDLTRLQALEPVARNVALRRSNPDNQWVLSTNTDMIFVPRSEMSLSGVSAGLQAALYHIPRFEIPETLWESLDRGDPGATIGEIARWGWKLHLNEIVLGSDTILFDAPGDFQLAPRADLFRIDGFDERMLLGWHVDSNLARRLGFLHGPPRSLADFIFGYHCDHTRQVTPAHRHDRVENDWRILVDRVDEAPIPEQRDGWGLAGEAVEEIRLGENVGRYFCSLRNAIGEAMHEPSEIAYTTESYDKIAYDPRHVMPFLIDALSCYPRETKVGWIGVETGLLARFTAAWRALGFVGDVRIPAVAHWLAAPPASETRRGGFAELAATSDVFVVDFGPHSHVPGADGAGAAHAIRLVNFWFRNLILNERQRLQNAAMAPRRFIAVNTVHGAFQEIVRAHIGAPLVPPGTRLRQGFVLPADLEPRALLPVLEAGEAGIREGTSIATRLGAEGYVFYGGGLDLLVGVYRAVVDFEKQSHAGANSLGNSMWLEVVTGNHYLALRELTAADLSRGKATLDFMVTGYVAFYLLLLRIEVRLFSRGFIPARVTGVTLEPLKNAPSGSSGAIDWLPLMFIGDAGEQAPPRTPWWQPRRSPPAAPPPNPTRRATAPGVRARSGVAGFVIFGPYVTLLPGRHLLEVDLGPDPAQAKGAWGKEARLEAGQVKLEVFAIAENEFLAEHSLPARSLGREPERLEFTVPDRPSRSSNPMRLEFRVWNSGSAGFMVRGIRTRPLALLPIEQAGEEPVVVESISAESEIAPQVEVEERR